MDFFDRYLLKEEKKKEKKQKIIKILWILLIYALFIILALNSYLGNENKNPTTNSKSIKTWLTASLNAEKWGNKVIYKENETRLHKFESVL